MSDCYFREELSLRKISCYIFTVNSKLHLICCTSSAEYKIFAKESIMKNYFILAIATLSSLSLFANANRTEGAGDSGTTTAIEKKSDKQPLCPSCPNPSYPDDKQPLCPSCPSPSYPDDDKAENYDGATK